MVDNGGLEDRLRLQRRTRDKPPKVRIFLFNPDRRSQPDTTTPILHYIEDSGVVTPPASLPS